MGSKEEDIVDLIHSKSQCVTLMRETQSSKKTFGIFEIFKNGIKYRSHVYCQLCEKSITKEQSFQYYSPLQNP